MCAALLLNKRKTSAQAILNLGVSPASDEGDDRIWRYRVVLYRVNATEVELLRQRQGQANRTAALGGGEGEAEGGGAVVRSGSGVVSRIGDDDDALARQLQTVQWDFTRVWFTSEGQLASELNLTNLERDPVHYRLQITTQNSLGWSQPSQTSWMAFPPVPQLLPSDPRWDMVWWCVGAEGVAAALSVLVLAAGWLWRWAAAMVRPSPPFFLLCGNGISSSSSSSRAIVLAAAAPRASTAQGAPAARVEPAPGVPAG